MYVPLNGIVLPIFELYINQIILHVLLCIIFFNIISLRFIYVIVHTCTLSIFIAVCIPHYVNISQLIRSIIDGRLGCCQLGVIVSVAMNVYMHVL